MNGESLCRGHTTIHSFLSPSKPRAPLQDHSVSLLHEVKLPSEHTVQNEAKRKGEGRVEPRPGGHIIPSEEEASPCSTGRAEGGPPAAPRPSSTLRGKGANRRARMRKPTPETNRKVTDYYPIRRSCRKSQAELKCEEQQHIEDLIQRGVEEGLQVRVLEDKGRGVFATRSFRKGQFVVEYHGDLLQIKDAKKREEQYAQNPATGCYMYYFQHLNKTYCVDATKETTRLGRLINHSKNGNCQTKLHNINGIPHLILVASRDIEAGEELLYDYGDRSKDAIAAHPWLKH